jgi:hypothetical protein
LLKYFVMANSISSACPFPMSVYWSNNPAMIFQARRHCYWSITLSFTNRSQPMLINIVWKGSKQHPKHAYWARQDLVDGVVRGPHRSNWFKAIKKLRRKCWQIACPQFCLAFFQSFHQGVQLC